MLFRHASYQSLSSPADPKTGSAAPLVLAGGGVHKGLQLFVVLQILCVTMSCLAVIGAESDDHKTLTWAQAIYNPQTRFWLPLLSALTYMLSCVFLRVVFPTHRLWLLRLGLVCTTVALSLLLSFWSACIVCDPVVRVVRDTGLDHITIFGSTAIAPSSWNGHVILSPLSLVSAMGPGWVAESAPSFFQCAALTPFALQGRMVVSLALLNVSFAFLVTTLLAHIYRGTFHATSYAIVLYSFVFVALIESIFAVVLNEEIWDWRLLYLMLASAAGSSYLAASVVNLPPPPAAPLLTHSSLIAANDTNTHLLPKTKPPPAPVLATAGTLGRATWLTIQPVLAVECFLEKLDDDNNNEISTAAPENPFPLANSSSNGADVHHA